MRSAGWLVAIGNMGDDWLGLELHKAVFANDVNKVGELVRTCDLGEKDKFGNSPLHLATMLGHREVVNVLLANGAPVKIRNNLGWSPLAEAVSYGDRYLVGNLLKKLKQQSRQTMDCRRPDLVNVLNLMSDFYMELKWDFQSWIPLVSRILPSDTCKIHKRGCSIRMDTTLIDFSDMKWERGDVSFLFQGGRPPGKALTVLDNVQKVFQMVKYEESEAELDDEVDILMGNDIVCAHISTKTVSFSRQQTGWLLRENKTEKVGRFLADFYHVNGLSFEWKKRREHLTEQDLSNNKAIVESFKGMIFSKNDKGGNSLGNDVVERPPRRKSLPPPPKCQLSFEDYLNSNVQPVLARSPSCKETSKVFKATVAMSNEFPLSVEALLNILEVIAPFKHFNKLRQFVELKLPVGFPVKIDIPILPTVTARVTFQDFELRDNIDPTLFQIPTGYREDMGRFPGL